MAAVNPFGAKRSDIRQAIHTANLIAATPGRNMNAEEYMALRKALTDYLACDAAGADDEADMEALQRMKAGG